MKKSPKNERKIVAKKRDLERKEARGYKRLERQGK